MFDERRTGASVRLFDDEEELDAWRLRGSSLALVEWLGCTGVSGEPCSRDRADCSPGTSDAERCDPGRAEKLPRHQGTSRPCSGGGRSGCRCPHRPSAAPRHGVAGESSDDQQRVRLAASAVDRPADLGPGSRHPIVRRCVGERGRRPAVMGSRRFWTTESRRRSRACTDVSREGADGAHRTGCGVCSGRRVSHRARRG